MFLGERDAVSRSSILTGVHNYNNHDHDHNYSSPADDPMTPPDDFPITDQALRVGGTAGNPSDVSAWLEIWDYAGGTSFRAFVSEDPDKSLFVFFDAGILGRDVKRA